MTKYLLALCHMGNTLVEEWFIKLVVVHTQKEGRERGEERQRETETDRDGQTDKQTQRKLLAKVPIS
jgi:hypothetical protein